MGSSSDDILILNATKNTREGKWGREKKKAGSGKWKEKKRRIGRRMIAQGTGKLKLRVEAPGYIKNGSKFGRRSAHWLVWSGRGQAFHFSLSSLSLCSFDLCSWIDCVGSLLDLDALFIKVLWVKPVSIFIYSISKCSGIFITLFT